MTTFASTWCAFVRESHYKTVCIYQIFWFGLIDVQRTRTMDFPVIIPCTHPTEVYNNLIRRKVVNLIVSFMVITNAWRSHWISSSQEYRFCFHLEKFIVLREWCQYTFKISRTLSKFFGITVHPWKWSKLALSISWNLNQFELGLCRFYGCSCMEAIHNSFHSCVSGIEWKPSQLSVI